MAGSDMTFKASAQQRVEEISVKRFRTCRIVHVPERNLIFPDELCRQKATNNTLRIGVIPLGIST